jgi:ribosome maturation factor RimP
MTDRVTTIRAELTPIVESLGLSVYDVTLTGGDRPTLSLTVDRPRADDAPAAEQGVDLDTLETATRTVSAALDAMDPVHGRYLLEVSSPGLERTLRTAEHFAGAHGEVVTVKARDAEGHVARLRGVLVTSDAESITLTTDAGDHTVALDAVEAARTVFEWGPAPKPGKGSRPGRKKEVATR